MSSQRKVQRKAKRRKKKKSKDPGNTTEPTSNGVAAEEDTELQDAPTFNGTGLATPPEEEPEATSSRAEVSNAANIEHPFGTDFLESTDPSCFYSTRISLHVSIPAVSLSTAQNSVLSMHLAPLLLTYFPPAKGIVLAFSDPVLSARPGFGVCLPLGPPKDGAVPETLPEDVMSRTADEFGACWVWLTVTFLVFRPERGDQLRGWTNVTSKGFVGLLSYNFFQAAIGKARIPDSWTWDGEKGDQGKRKGRKARLRDDSGNWNSQSSTLLDDDVPQDTRYPRTQLSDGGGSFLDESGSKVPDTLEYRVVDTEMVSEKDKWALNIDGSLLNEEAEQKVLEEERIKFERRHSRRRSTTPATDVEMSGGLGENAEEGDEADSPQ